jgi:hypothetical protein
VANRIAPITEFWREWAKIRPLRIAGNPSGISGSYSAVSSGLGGDSGIIHAATHVSQLD